MDFINQLNELLKELAETQIKLGEINILLDQLLTKHDKIIEFPQDDKLIRAGEAARILNVSKATIYWYASEGLLAAYYTAGSNHKKFWLSDVKNLAERRSNFYD